MTTLMITIATIIVIYMGVMVYAITKQRKKKD